MTSIAIGVAGVFAGILIAWIIYWLCLKNGSGSRAFNEEALEDIAMRARSIRQSSEDIETRVARMQELRRIRERASDLKEREEG